MLLIVIITMEKIPTDFDFPTVPDGAYQIEGIRQPYVKASAYYTILS